MGKNRAACFGCYRISVGAGNSRVDCVLGCSCFAERFGRFRGKHPCLLQYDHDLRGRSQQKWSAEFDHLPKPLTAVIVGGAIKKKEFSLDNAVDLGNKIRLLKEKTGGSILITTSRRTGEKAEKAIMDALKDIPAHTFLWGEKKENPYMGYLACADNIVVTGDSVSMCCEACGTKKPVFVFTGKKWLTRKHIRFVASLYKNGYAVALKEHNLDFKPKKSLNASVDAAKQIELL